VTELGNIANGIRLYEGDARDVLPTLDSESVDAVVTDPPFKLSQAYTSNVDADNLSAVASLAWAAPEMLRICRPGAIAALFYDTRILPYAMDEMRRAGWTYLRALTLYRRWGAASKMLGWMSTSDFLLIYAKPGAKFQFHSADTKHDVYIRSSPEPESFGHPSQKPIACVEHIIDNVCPVGGVVLDPYAGTGTTLEAALNTGRRGIGVEINPAFATVIRSRVSRLEMPA